MTYQFSPDVIALNPELQQVQPEPEQKPSKYHNKRVQVDGITFDSGKELRDYRQLQLEAKAGEHIAVFHHVRFPLPGNSVYEADHVTLEFDGSWNAWDSKVKATKTQAYRLKKRLFREKYGKEIKEI